MWSRTSITASDLPYLKRRSTKVSTLALQYSTPNAAAYRGILYEFDLASPNDESQRDEQSVEKARCKFKANIDSAIIHKNIAVGPSVEKRVNRAYLSLRSSVVNSSMAERVSRTHVCPMFD